MWKIEEYDIETEETFIGRYRVTSETGDVLEAIRHLQNGDLDKISQLESGKYKGTEVYCVCS